MFVLLGEDKFEHLCGESPIDFVYPVTSAQRIVSNLKGFVLFLIEFNMSKERLYLQKWDGWSAFNIEEESEKQNLAMLIHCCTKEKFITWGP